MSMFRSIALAYGYYIVVTKQWKRVANVSCIYTLLKKLSFFTVHSSSSNLEKQVTVFLKQKIQ